MDFWRLNDLETIIEKENGTDLIVFHAEGIRPEQTIRAKLGMLEHAASASFVPLRHERLDGVVRFRYRLTGLRRLSAVLKAEEWNETRWEGMLATLKIAVEEGRKYFVGDSDLVLHPDWIFAEGDVRRLRFIAVPLRGFGSAVSPWEQWRAMYETLLRYGLPDDWARRLNPGRWEKETFSHALWIESIDERLRPPFAPAFPGDDADAADGPVPERGKYGLPPREELRVAESGVTGGKPIGSSAPAEDGETMRFTARTVSRKEGICLFVAFFCWIAFVWKPSLPLFAAAVLGSVPLGFALWGRYQGGVSAGEPIGAHDPFSYRSAFGSGSVAAFGDSSGHPPGDTFGNSAKPTDADRSRISDADPHEVRSTFSAQELAHRTLLLDAADKTVRLDASEYESNYGGGRLDIVYDPGDRIESVPMGEAPVKIGRESDAVDVVIDHPAVSRMHLEIYRDGAIVMAKDVGSTNGTHLNDRSIVPLESYKLEDGDTLRVPGATIRYSAYAEPARVRSSE